MPKALVMQGELSNVFVWACTGYIQGSKAGCAEAEYDRRDHPELSLARLYTWVLLDSEWISKCCTGKALA